MDRITSANVAAQGMMQDKMMGGQMIIDKSKPTVAIIRADWCQACQKLEPTMMELMSQYKDRLNFVLLDVTTDEKAADSAKTARQLGIVYPVIPIQLGFIGAQTAAGGGKTGRASVQGFVLSLLFVIGIPLTNGRVADARRCLLRIRN